MLILVLICAFLALVKCEKSEYCCVDQRHLLCINQEKDFARRCNVVRITASPQSDSEKRTITNLFNQERQKVADGKKLLGKTGGSNQLIDLPTAANMMELEWDEELENAAFNLAYTCPGQRIRPQCDKCNLFERFKGYDLSWPLSTKDYELPTKASFEKFLDTIYRRFNNEFKKSGNTDHYSFLTSGSYQFPLLWGEVSKFGCAHVYFKIFGQEDSFVHNIACIFGGRENYPGSSYYSIGRSCSKCRNNSECSKQFSGLCKCTGKCLPLKGPELQKCKKDESPKRTLGNNSISATDAKADVNSGLKADEEELNIDYCCISEQHPLCGDKTKNFEKKCNVILADTRPKGQSGKDIIIEKFNRQRQTVVEGKAIFGDLRMPRASDMMQLEWDSELQKVAANLVHVCPDQPMRIRGENSDLLARFKVYFVEWSKNSDVYEIAVNAIFDEFLEVLKARFSSQIRSRKSGDLLSFLNNQSGIFPLYWGQVTKFGCVHLFMRKYGKNKQTPFVHHIGCAFGGSKTRNGPYYSTGKSCSKCHKESNCSSKYTGLCECTGNCLPPKVKEVEQCKKSKAMSDANATSSDEADNSTAMDDNTADSNNSTTEGNNTLKDNTTADGNNTLNDNSTADVNSTMNSNSTADGNNTMNGNITAGNNNTVTDNSTKGSNNTVENDNNASANNTTMQNSTTEGNKTLSGTVTTGSNLSSNATLQNNTAINPTNGSTSVTAV